MQELYDFVGTPNKEKPAKEAKKGLKGVPYLSHELRTDRRLSGGLISFKRYLPILAVDLITLTIALLLCYEFTSAKLIEGLASSNNFLKQNLDRVIFYASVVVLILVLFKVNGLYKHKVIQTRVEQLFYIFRSFVIADLIVITTSFLFLNTTISIEFKDFLIWFNLWGVVTIFAGRMVFRHLIKYNDQLSTLKPAKNIIIIGAGQAGKLYAAALKNQSTGTDNIVFLDDDETKLGTGIFNYRVVGKPEDVVFKAITFGAEEVCITINNIEKERLLEILQHCKRTGLPLKVLSSHYNLMFTGMYDRSDNMLQTVPIYNNGSNNTIDMFIKRSMDILGSMALLVLMSIPCLILGLIIKLTSEGPVFHQSYRVGERGKLFKIFKYRSMYVNGGEHHQAAAKERLSQGKHMGKVENDPRITPIGRFIRKYSIDELPQIWNVFKGDMSLVGPRPCFEYEMAMFEEWHNRRFLMKPGITGLWQITGRQMNDLLLNDAMSTDVFYTDNFSIWIDFRILFKTIPVILAGQGK